MRKEALKLIEENPKVLFISDVCKGLGISSSTFYRKVPTDSELYQDITDALEGNKTLLKQEIRDRLKDCKSPVGLLALYRLVGNQEERDALNSYREEKKESKNEEIILKIE